MNDDFLKNLSDEQKAQLKNCKTPEDMLAFAKKAGYELSDDALDAVSGGDDCVSFSGWEERCPEAGIEYSDQYN